MQLAVVVTPKSGRDEVVGWTQAADGSRELAVRVRAVPERGKATKAACELLAKHFGLPKRSVTCVRGGASRHKMMELPLAPEQLDALG